MGKLQKPKRTASKNTAERVGNTLTPQFPSTGHSCRGHQYKNCFRVDMFGVSKDANDTFHFMDEGGAILFAMQQSRNHGTTAAVTGPDGKEIVVFRKRSYDVDAVRHALWEYNERMHIGGDKYTDRNREATAKRKESNQRRLSKTPPKKKLVKR